MKECKKCGNDIVDEDKIDLCDRCIENRKKIIIVGASIVAVTTAAIIYITLKGKVKVEVRKLIPDTVKPIFSGITSQSEPTFNGLSQNSLDKLAKETSRGVKAVIEDGGVNFFFKSASGKQMQSAFYRLNEAGEIVCYTGNGSYLAANSPRFFLRKLYTALEEVSNIVV